MCLYLDMAFSFAQLRVGVLLLDVSNSLLISGVSHLWYLVAPSLCNHASFYSIALKFIINEYIWKHWIHFVCSLPFYLCHSIFLSLSLSLYIFQSLSLSLSFCLPLPLHLNLSNIFSTLFLILFHSCKFKNNTSNKYKHNHSIFLPFQT